MGIEVLFQEVSVEKEHFDQLGRALDILASMPPLKVSKSIKRSIPDARMNHRVISVDGYTTYNFKYKVKDYDCTYPGLGLDMNRLLASRTYTHQQVLALKPSSE